MKAASITRCAAIALLLAAVTADAMAPPASAAPPDLAAVAEQLRFAFRPLAGDGQYEATHPAYGVRVEPDGSFELVPASGSPMSFTTTHAPRVTSVRALADGTVAMERGPITERLRNGGDGLEQSWRFERRPATGAGLTVRVHATGLVYAGRTAQGLHFADPVGHRGVRYGAARWIDARGRSTAVSARWDSGEIVMRVPPSVIARSAFPAVLDPTIGPEIGSDNPVLSAAGGTGAQVVFDGTNWFVVWADQRGGYGGAYQIFGAHVAPDGTVREPYGIPIASSPTDLLLSPQVGYDGTNYLVVWSQGASSTADLVGVRVSKAGVVLDGTPFVVAAGQANQRVGAAQIASDGSAWLVAYMLDTNSHAGIAAARVTGQGKVGPQIPIAPTVSAFYGYPHLVFDGANYLVVYAAYDSASNVTALQAALVTAAGNLAAAGFDPAPGARVGGDYRSGPAVGFDGTNFLVVWPDVRTPASVDLYAALVSRAGVPLSGAGNKIFANVARAADPAVAFDGANYMVAFGVPAGIVTAVVYGARVDKSARILDAGGIDTRQDPEYLGGMAIAYDGSANYLLTGGTGLGSRISKSGVLLDAVPFAIDTTANRQTYPTATFDGTDYFVAWQDTRNRSVSIYGTRVTPSGTIRDPAGIAICTFPAARPSELAAASDGAGNVLVAWVDQRNNVDFISGHTDVYGAMVQHGTPGANFAIGTTTTSGLQHDEPTIAFDGTNFLVVTRTWLNTSPNTNGFDGYRLTRAGAVIDGFPIFSTTVSNTYSSPGLSFDGTNYLLAYTYMTGAFPLESYRTYATRITPGKQILDPSGIPVSPGGRAAYAIAPRTTFDGTNHLVVWMDRRNDPGDFTNADVYGARVTKAGTVLDAASFPITTAPGNQYPLAVLDAGDGAVSLVEWIDQTTNDLWGGVIDRSGAQLDPPALLEGGVTGGGALAGEGAGRFLVAYDRYDPAPPFDAIRVRARLLSLAPPTTTSTTSSSSTSTSSSSTSTSSTSTSVSTSSTSSTSTSTSSTSSTAPGATTSTTSSAPPTTTPSSSTTTTTAPAVCGNGILEGREECDDGPQNGRVVSCCREDCRAKPANASCGQVEAQGECDRGDQCDAFGQCRPRALPEGSPCGDDGFVCTADVCDGQGTCAHRPVAVGTPCGDIPAGECDLLDFCDGVNPGCPSGNGTGQACKAETTPDAGAGRIAVDCSAQDILGAGGRASCGAVGREAVAKSGAVTNKKGGREVLCKRPVLPDVAQTKAGRPVTQVIRPRSLIATGPARRTRLTLKLNPLGKNLLKRNGCLTVSVQTTIRQGNAKVTRQALVTLLRKLR